MLISEWPTAFGVASAVLGTAAFLPYLREMVLGRAYPLRATWLIWSVLSAMAVLSNISKGADSSLPFLLTQAGFTTLIFLMSLRYGMGGLLRRGDLGLLCCAGIGLLLWMVTQDAFWALIIAIGISALGGALTVVKTYRHPQTESACCWLLAAGAAICGVGSVASWDMALLVYPVYLTVLYIAILLAIWAGRRTGQGVLLATPAPL